MLKRRIIPCLDVHGGHVTRGVRFGRAEAGELRNVGDPVELAMRYDGQGADEMVFYDITATAHGRAAMVDGSDASGGGGRMLSICGDGFDGVRPLARASHRNSMAVTMGPKRKLVGR
jgi:imidazole glycerol phosphate synthase subunit HisF